MGQFFFFVSRKMSCFWGKQNKTKQKERNKMKDAKIKQDTYFIKKKFIVCILLCYV